MFLLGNVALTQSVLLLKDSSYKILVLEGLCNKPLQIRVSVESNQFEKVLASPFSMQSHRLLRKNKSVIAIQGELYYEFLYQSYIDTPFAQKDFQQHSIQSRLKVTVNDYPFLVNVSQQISNSPYFKDRFYPTLQFDQRTYLTKEKQKLLQKVETEFGERSNLKRLESELNKLATRIKTLKGFAASPDNAQRVVEERERDLYKQQSFYEQQFNLPAIEFNNRIKAKKDVYYDTLKRATDRLEERLEILNQEIDSINQIYTATKNRVDSVKADLNKKLALARTKIQTANSVFELNKLSVLLIEEQHKKSHFRSTIDKVRNVSLGNSPANYSELTVWNLSLTGVQIEYGLDKYTAVGIGKIDYSSRFLPLKRKEQFFDNTLVIGRFGIGDKDHKAIIATGFSAKDINNHGFSNSSKKNIYGYSIQGIIQENENWKLVAEIAKTNKAVDSVKKGKSLWEMKDASNMAVMLRGEKLIRLTGTRLSGFYRYNGKDFQSLNIFNYNTGQAAWMIKAEQALLKNSLFVSGSVRQNDFVSVFSQGTAKSSTVFKSLNVTLRRRKLPVVNVGYYPGTQLYVLNDNRIEESIYYVFSSSLSHTYHIGVLEFASYINYYDYSSKGSFNAFINYDGKRYHGAQSCIYSIFKLTADLSFSDQEDLRYSTSSIKGEANLRNWLTVEAGFQKNKIVKSHSYFGSNAAVNLNIGKIGSLQVLYEKNFLPTIYKTLFPFEQGRVTWYKHF